MGCWNGTDMLTQLPILAGEPVKLFILADNYSEGGFCYCEDRREVQFLPISGQYDDGGCIENVEEDWHTKAVLDQCNKLLASKEWGLSKRGKQMEQYDNACSFPYSTIRELLRAIERSYLAYTRNGYFKEDKTIKLVLIHDEIYQNALEISGLSKDYRCKVIPKIKKVLRDIDVANDFFKSHVRKMAFTEIFNQFPGKGLSKFYPEFLIQNKNNAKVVKSLLDRMLDFTRLYHFMETTRKGFIEQAGAGSQVDDFLSSACFLKAALQFAIKKHNDRCDDEDEKI